MATKTVCDRCGKEIGCWNFRQRIWFPLVKKSWKTVDKDICGDCIEELNKFMDGAKVVE